MARLAFAYQGLPQAEAMLRAVQAGDAESVQALIEAGYDAFAHVDPATGMTALHYAAALNARAIVKLLMKTGGFNLSALDRFGRSPASLAIEVADNPAMGRFLYDSQYRQSQHRESGGDTIDDSGYEAG